MVTPQAVEIMKSLAQKFGFPEVAINTKYVPHPQLPTYTYDGTPKENLVVTVGRWDRKSWFQKNPQLLLKSLERFLESRHDYHSLIIGSSVSELEPLLKTISQEAASRITLIPFLSADELRDTLRRSKIGFWPSRHEGQQGTGAQALCCGCSVVSTAGLAMSCFAHYASRGSGRQAIRNDALFVGDALTMEAIAWDEGERDPLAISNRWVKEFHHSRVAHRLLELAENTSHSIIASNP
jgi:glycosyltransferase involved in cell wall biosynthesis